MKDDIIPFLICANYCTSKNIFVLRGKTDSTVHAFDYVSAPAKHPGKVISRKRGYCGHNDRDDCRPQITRFDICRGFLDFWVSIDYTMNRHNCHYINLYPSGMSEYGIFEISAGEGSESTVRPIRAFGHSENDAEKGYPVVAALQKEGCIIPL